jgi:hypothetical protein
MNANEYNELRHIPYSLPPPIDPDHHGDVCAARSGVPKSNAEGGTAGRRYVARLTSDLTSLSTSPPSSASPPSEAWKTGDAPGHVVGAGARSPLLFRSNGATTSWIRVGRSREE